MSLARQLELREQYGPAPAKAAPRGLLPAPPPCLALPGPPADKVATPTVTVDGQPVKRPSRPEQEERRRQGLCFNCNEKYTRGSSTSTVSSSPPTPQPPTEAPVFSLHVVAGVAVSNTIQLQVLLGTATFVALVDTGSTHSFIGEVAARGTGLSLEPRPRLTAKVANGERVSCPGILRQAPVIIDDMEFRVDLYVMPLAGYHVVLGTHWMATLGPIVWDLAAGTMAFQQEGRDICWRGVAPPSQPGVHVAMSTDSLLDGMLGSFADVFAEPTGLPPARGRDHRIILKPDAPPVAVRPYRYPAAHKDELERQCPAMIELGIVCRSDSAFSFPVILVKKPDGSWRFCVDYRALNALTVKDAFPILVLLDELHGSRFFTKLDLRSGYHQVRMRPEDIHKTAFRTHNGLYEFLVMPFGLCNSPANFQALMNNHILFVKRSKCAFGVSSIAYLGHIISEAGVAMDPGKVQAIHDWPVPRSAQVVRGFLGLAGYYRKFIHNYGFIAAPLTILLKKDGFSWGEEATAAFAALKAAVTTAPVLAVPDFTKPFIVECDASSHGFGAVLIQDGHPIAFFSRLVAPRHHALAAYERELIGLPYLWGHRFLVKTDHYRLKYLLDQRLATILQHHWVGKLLGFDFSVEYKPGASNAVADALSRRDTEEGELLVLCAPRFDFIDRLLQAQLSDPALFALCGDIDTGARCGRTAQVNLKLV
ncbi:LOW QUALITY PROTEIN: hypothetical protein U9M48_029095 [Paspalum notatum var. saurae]|uniref:Reverse transcriptase/retrotransposon-derived protein RNase H-like domain-containing protein n=1 Tax=Paspalum notatum var. saurae TaxID=547442 RepID=A0AAQ3TY58_PASNO